MRIGSNSLTQRKSLSQTNTLKGLIPNKNKFYNPNYSDEFVDINKLIPVSGTWTTNGTKISTSTSASAYPTIVNYDLLSQNITATLSLDSAGIGVVFWLQDSSNWWAATTFYTLTTGESYVSGTTDCNCRDRGYCFGSDANGQLWGCTVCDTCNVTSTRNVYRFYVRLLKSVSGVVTTESNLLLRTTCSATSTQAPCTVATNDNINGIRLTVSNNSITVQGRNDSNTFYTTPLSYTAVGANKGYKNGLIFTPGSTYLQSSLADNISIVGS
jgi:hypothetical protein